nr:hypothetical protein CPGR_05737 [Mycolicibacterium fortuitum subsp. fortuitum DSM 46621 = ATCC 6841 = JCM 6387]
MRSAEGLARTDPLQVCVVVSPRNSAPTRRSGVTDSTPACDNAFAGAGVLLGAAVVRFPAAPPAVVPGTVHAAAPAAITAAATVNFAIRVTRIITILPDRAGNCRNAGAGPARSNAQAGRDEPAARVCGTLENTAAGRHSVLPQRGDEAR